MLTFNNKNQEIPLTPLTRGKLNSPFSKGVRGILNVWGK